MNRKRILLVALVLLIIILPLFYFLVYVPHEFGKQYVSVSFRPVFFKYYGSGDVEIEYDERLLRAAGVYVKINVTNNYPNSVFVKYNGFDVVLLIYNQSLPPHNDPSDVVGNKNFLVWGAFYNARSSTFNGDGFEYYASRREQTNFTSAIRYGAHWRNQPCFDLPGLMPNWHWGYWFNSSSYVRPGTYYMYCIVFGIASEPHNFTIISVPW